MNGTSVRKHRTGHLYKRTPDGEYIQASDKKPGVYYLQYRIAGKKHRQCLNTSDPDQAERERLRIMAPYLVADEKEAIRTMKDRLVAADEKLTEIDREKSPLLSIDQAWPAYLAAVNRPDSGPRTLKGYASQWALFAEWLKERHPSCRAFADVTRLIAQAYAGYLLRHDRFPAAIKPVSDSDATDKKPRKGRAKPAFSTNTYNKHIRLLELVFRVLSDESGMTLNPWSHISRKMENKASRRELTVQELNTICNNASGELQTLLTLGIYTGLRLGDCCTLRWSEVDLDRRIIMRIPNKTSRRKATPVHVPIHPTLFAVLGQIPISARQGFVLPAIAARYRNNDSDVAKDLRQHFKSCGIQIHKDGTGKGMDTRAVVEVGFHSLRHSFVSLCRQSNAPLAVVEAIVGHSNPSMTRHYTHIGEAAAASAIALLPNLGGTSDIQATENLPKDSPTLAALRSMTPRNWRQIRDRLLATQSSTK